MFLNEIRRILHQDRISNASILLLSNLCTVHCSTQLNKHEQLSIQDTKSYSGSVASSDTKGGLILQLTSPSHW